jgi:hypothetical protein
MDVDDVSIHFGTSFVDLGPDITLFDRDGDGVETLQLIPITNVVTGGRWTLNGELIVSNSSEIVLDAPVGTHIIETAFGSSYDAVTVRVVGKAEILLEDSFDGNGGGWRLVDEGELGEPANWSISGGKLIQRADRKSRQLMGSGDETPTVEWSLTWSPLGDGYHTLRKGTYALWEDPFAMQWQDYSVTIKFYAPSGGSVGVMVRYQDPSNYLKLELDVTGGSSQLIELLNGIEQIQWQSQIGYDISGSNTLRVDVEGPKVSAFLDNFSLFTPVAFDVEGQGTVGLYTWGAPGTEFDYINVVQLPNSSLGDFNPIPTTPLPTSTPKAPTAVPNSSPAEPGCDDNRFEKFFVEATGKKEPCTWLAARMDQFGDLCKEGHPSGAHEICRETCGKCADKCEDKDMAFTYDGIKRDCRWLSLRNWIIDQPGVCAQGSEAANACPETCNICDATSAPALSQPPIRFPSVTPSSSSSEPGLPTSAPSLSQSQNGLPSSRPSFSNRFSPAVTTMPKTPSNSQAPSTDPYCDDLVDVYFFVEGEGNKTCQWLAARKNVQENVCVFSHEAFHICEETCGKCSDDCRDDSNGKFLDHYRNGVMRDCKWLADRGASFRSKYCEDGEPARNICMETCDVCDGVL